MIIWTTDFLKEQLFIFFFRNYGLHYPSGSCGCDFIDSVDLALKGGGFALRITPGYAVLMIPSENETAVRGCHCPVDMASGMVSIFACCAHS